VVATAMRIAASMLDFDIANAVLPGLPHFWQ
jgi:hypothetical protein